MTDLNHALLEIQSSVLKMALDEKISPLYREMKEVEENMVQSSQEMRKLLSTLFIFSLMLLYLYYAWYLISLTRTEAGMSNFIEDLEMKNQTMTYLCTTEILVIVCIVSKTYHLTIIPLFWYIFKSVYSTFIVSIPMISSWILGDECPSNLDQTTFISSMIDPRYIVLFSSAFIFLWVVIMKMRFSSKFVDDNLRMRVERQRSCPGSMREEWICWKPRHGIADSFCICIGSVIVVLMIVQMEYISLLFIHLTLRYVIHHECSNYSTISSTFRRKGDSVFMIVLIPLMIGLMKGQIVKSVSMTMIFIYNTGQHGNGKNHMFFVILASMADSWTISHLTCAMIYGSSGMIAEMRMDSFKVLYKKRFSNTHFMNIEQGSGVRHYINWPVYNNDMIQFLCGVSFVSELVLMVL